jgi:carbamoyl-phosphate synthase small subunit
MSWTSANCFSYGSKNKKMFLGHRGANHPVKNLKNGLVEITSQNHGFEVSKKSIPSTCFITHTHF